MCSGAEGFTSESDQEEVRKIERQLKNRFPIGSHVSEQRIIQDFLKQVCVGGWLVLVPSCIDSPPLLPNTHTELHRACHPDRSAHYAPQRRVGTSLTEEGSLQDKMN